MSSSTEPETGWEGTVSVELAKQLRDSGLVWRPKQFDRFHIPDRLLEDEVFSIADLSTEVLMLADGIGAITFNGAVEWSLDYILTQDVVWLPTESQLRRRLGSSFLSLTRNPNGYCCAIDLQGALAEFDAPTAADAYGCAVLAELKVR